MVEQQMQRTAQKTAPTEALDRESEQQKQTPSVAWAAQALLSGATIHELPRTLLAELAERVGNSGMLALAAMRAPEVTIQTAALTGREVHTEPTVVPKMACQLAPAADLTVGSWPSEAFDPAGLA